MIKKLLLIGGGGHCKSILDVLFSADEYDDIALIDKNENIGNSVLGIKVIGCDNDLERLYAKGYTHAFIAIGGKDSVDFRISMYQKLLQIGFILPNIIDDSAAVAHDAEINSGFFAGKNAVMNSSCIIGQCATVNSGAIIEHDCVIGAFVHIAPGAVLCGGVSVGENTFIGAGSVIKQGIKIGSNVTVGMGSVVLCDIKDNTLAYGNPCREVKKS